MSITGFFAKFLRSTADALDGNGNSTTDSASNSQPHADAKRPEPVKPTIELPSIANLKRPTVRPTLVVPQPRVSSSRAHAADSSSSSSSQTHREQQNRREQEKERQHNKMIVDNVIRPQLKESIAVHKHAMDSLGKGDTKSAAAAFAQLDNIDAKITRDMHGFPYK